MSPYIMKTGLLHSKLDITVFHYKLTVVPQKYQKLHRRQQSVLFPVVEPCQTDCICTTTIVLRVYNNMANNAVPQISNVEEVLKP